MFVIIQWYETAITPNFDALIANDAVSFSNAYCQNTVCVPSRCSFLGLFYPHVPYQVEEPYFSAIDRTLLLEK